MVRCALESSGLAGQTRHRWGLHLDAGGMPRLHWPDEPAQTPGPNPWPKRLASPQNYRDHPALDHPTLMGPRDFVPCGIGQLPARTHRAAHAQSKRAAGARSVRSRPCWRRGQSRSQAASVALDDRGRAIIDKRAAACHSSIAVFSSRARSLGTSIWVDSAGSTDRSKA